MIKVWRIENEFGLGVFKCGASSRAYNALRLDSKIDQTILQKLKSPWDHPTPTEESISGYRFTVHICAFADIKHYALWFNVSELRKALRFAGVITPVNKVKIVEYEIPEEDVSFGKIQCIFERGNEVKIRSYECDEVEHLLNVDK
jgi:hypothetical protein